MSWCRSSSGSPRPLVRSRTGWPATRTSSVLQVAWGTDVAVALTVGSLSRDRVSERMCRRERRYQIGSASRKGQGGRVPSRRLEPHVLVGRKRNQGQRVDGVV